jgi:hypothetical protein
LLLTLPTLLSWPNSSCNGHPTGHLSFHDPSSPYLLALCFPSILRKRWRQARTTVPSSRHRRTRARRVRHRSGCPLAAPRRARRTLLTPRVRHHPLTKTAWGHAQEHKQRRSIRGTGKRASSGDEGKRIGNGKERRTKHDVGWVRVASPRLASRGNLLRLPIMSGRG